MFSLNPVSLLATTALGPVGGIVAQLAQQVFSQVGQQFLQQLGNNLQLPQSTIDMAQAEFSGSIGDFGGVSMNLNQAVEAFGQETGASSYDIGDAQRTLNDSIMKTASDIAGGDEVKSAKSGGKGGSWLMAMAKALGAKADQLADQMQNLADKMSTDKSDPSASLEFSAKSQEFGLFMNAASNALKTAGESLTTAARKGG